MLLLTRCLWLRHSLGAIAQIVLAFLQETHRPMRSTTSSVREWEGPLSAPLGEPGNVSWHPVGGSSGEPTDELEAIARQNTRAEGGAINGKAEKDKEELKRAKSRKQADRLVEG